MFISEVLVMNFLISRCCENLDNFPKKHLWLNFLFSKVDIRLALSCTLMKNGQTHFTNLAVCTPWNCIVYSWSFRVV